MKNRTRRVVHNNSEELRLCSQFAINAVTIKAHLHVPSTSLFLWAAPLIFLMLCVNSIIELH